MAAPDAKLGHLVNSDAHTELSECLEVFVLSQIIKHYEKNYIYSELTHAPKHVYE